MSRNSKERVRYVCDECGAESSRWVGKCPVCGAWNTMKEFREQAVPPGNIGIFSGEKKKPQLLRDISLSDAQRLPVGISDVDRPLGGGIVPGSVILWTGEPGIGKSTLVLQICQSVCRAGRKVLYCSGEESEYQIKMRAERLHMKGDLCYLISESNIQDILEETRHIQPDLFVIDSIQTMFLPGTDSSAGSPAQIRECAAALVRFAKETGIPVIIIGHVTKEGTLAGPRMLEHMVDVVLYLEGDRSYQFRILRAVKNRFGSTAETGLFMIDEDGLRTVEDPSHFLLAERNEHATGSVIFCCMEGLRPLLVEIQALAVRSVLAIPRRVSVGYDYNRLIVLLAVLERKAGISLSNHDVYINVAGGLKINEPAADLAVMAAVSSVYLNRSFPNDTIIMGEVGLTGEVRHLPHVDLRIKEASKMGFSRFILPEGNREEVERLESTLPQFSAAFINRGKELSDFMTEKES